MSKYLLEFEKSIKLIEDKIISLKKTSSSSGLNADSQIQNLEEELKKEFDSVLSNWSNGPITGKSTYRCLILLFGNKSASTFNLGTLLFELLVVTRIRCNKIYIK